MARYDTENFVKDLETIFKNNLSAKITALNAEKGDFSIDDIPSDAFYIDALPEVWNYATFIVWGFNEVSASQAQSDNFVKKVVLDYEVVVTDDAGLDSEHQFYWLLRYTRVLSDIVHENFDRFQGIARLSVDNLLPTAAVVGGKLLRSGGVRITASFTDR